MIKFNEEYISLASMSLETVLKLFIYYPEMCHIVDADNGVVRMAEND